MFQGHPEVQEAVPDLAVAVADSVAAVVEVSAEDAAAGSAGPEDSAAIGRGKADSSAIARIAADRGFMAMSRSSGKARTPMPKPFSLSGQPVPQPDFNNYRWSAVLGGPLRIPHVLKGDSTFFTLSYFGTRGQSAFLQRRHGAHRRRSAWEIFRTPWSMERFRKSTILPPARRFLET